MAKVNSYDPNKLEFRSGGGCLMLFGLPFFLAGMAVIVGSILSVGKEGFAALIGIPFGGLFALIGGGLMFGRSSTTFDKRTGKLTSWSGALGIGSTTEYKLEEIKIVTLSKEVRGSGKNRRTVYPVKLEGLPEPFELEASFNANDGRSLAEDVAKFLDLAMKDTSAGAEVIREAGTLDFSIRQRFEADGYVPELAPKPSNAKATHTAMGTTHKIHIPATGFHVGHYIQIGIGVFIGGFMGLGMIPVFLEGDMPTGLRLVIVAVFGLFAAIPFLAVSGSAFSSAKSVTDIEVTPMKLIVNTKGLISTSRQEMAANDMEELEIAGRPTGGRPNVIAFFGGRSIMARSDEKTIAFGSGLSDEELDWLISIVEVAVCS